MELDETEQRRIAARFLPELEERGIDVVFVGSTAVVGLELYPRTSADADALAAPGTGTSEARQVLEAIAEDEDDLVLVEKGKGTVSLAKRDSEGAFAWEIDVIVPALDLVPPEAAERVHAQATETEIGPTAIPEHVLAMKAIAYGDRRRDGDREGMEKYESDLLGFGDVVGEDFDWDEVEALLSRFPQPRRELAAEKLFDEYGRDLGLPSDEDPAIW